jgi:hypothetical protein
MPKQYMLEIPEIAQPKPKLAKASQKLTRSQALSNLRLLAKDLQRCEIFDDKKGVQRVTVTIRHSRAQYLETGIKDILEGVDASDALCVSKQRGQAKKEERDVVIAMVITELQNAGYTVEEAITFAAGELNLSEDTIRTSRKKGQQIAKFIERVTRRSESRDYRSYEPLIRLLHTSYLKPLK